MRTSFAAALVFAVSAAAWAGPGKTAPALKVKSFNPKAGRTRVKLESRIRVKFTKPIDLASVTPETANLRKLAGDSVPALYSIERGGKVLVLTPQGGLSASTDYEVVVRPGLLASNGATLKRDRRAIFFTETRISPLSILRPDQFELLGATMTEGRAAHSATTLGDGRVLLAGGFVDYVSHAAGADVYTPFTRTFAASAGPLTERRAYHPAVPFAGGVLLIGGAGVNGPLASTDLFVTDSSDFRAGPRLLEERDFVAATRLADGRILVVGGLHNEGQGAVYSSTAEIYDAEAGGFRFTHGAPVKRRAGLTLTVLPGGKVLVVGGQAGGSSTPVTAEIFDPETETFSLTPSAPVAHRQLHTATPIGSLGLVLFVDGGSAELEMYDATVGAFFSAGGASSVMRSGATVSALPDGRALIAGGVQDFGGGTAFALDGMDLWVPTGGDYGSVLLASVVFPEPRYGHTATTLFDDRVLFAGGFGQTSSASLNTAVLLTPDQPK